MASTALLDRATWEAALTALGANTLKTSLTTLGVVIGSASIVLVVSASLTGQRYIVAQVEAVGANVVYAERMKSSSEEDQVMALGDEMTLADLEAVRTSIPEVVEIAGTHEIPATVVVQGADHSVTLVGVTEGFQRLRNLVILKGRFLDADEVGSRAKVCLLTRELAAGIFPEADPIARIVRVGELRFTVVGVFEERVTTFGQSEIQRESVLIPFPLLSSYSGSEFVKVLYAQADRRETVPLVTRQVAAVLQARHRAAASYRVENLTSLLSTVRRIALALTIVLVLVAFVALGVSGIGIMNVMLVTVNERTFEIGLRKAVGATRREILTQFLLEAGLMGGVGAVVGVIGAVMLMLVVRPLLPPELGVSISGVSIVLALVVSCGTGVLFGYLPARMAAHLQPTEALRHE
nr:macrolide export ATP-binding/permease protein MacB [uncultured bacterium]